MDGQQLKQMIDRLAREVGFDLVAVSDASEFTDDREKALERIDAGLMDGLAWYTSGRVNRGADPEALLPGARSIVSLGWNYYVPDASGDAGGHGRVARYARGRDYHRVMKRRMRRLVREIAEELGESFAARWYVDDGPMLDRAAASRAGLGWFGKNGNILTPTLGSWVLLGQIITDLELPADAALMKTCGACTRCIPACPTDAIVAPYVVDNRRCISYLTIEHKGAIPRELPGCYGDLGFRVRYLPGCLSGQSQSPADRRYQLRASGPLRTGAGGTTGDGRSRVWETVCRHSNHAGETDRDATKRLHCVGECGRLSRRFRRWQRPCERLLRWCAVMPRGLWDALAASWRYRR